MQNGSQLAKKRASGIPLNDMSERAAKVLAQTRWRFWGSSLTFPQQGNGPLQVRFVRIARVGDSDSFRHHRH